MIFLVFFYFWTSNGEMGKRENQQKVLIDLHYLPCIEYFGILLHAKEVIFEANENYVKQSYRNRCKILTANGIDVLSVPVCGSGKKIKVKDIEIDYNQKWVQRHWRAIASAYGKSPFFEFYADEFQQIYLKKIPLLFDFNMELLKLCLKILQSDVSVAQSKIYQKEPDDEVTDYRSKINPKKADREYNKYRAYQYSQVFGSNFVENLSIIDLIFNEGTSSKEAVLKSCTMRQ